MSAFRLEGSSVLRSARKGCLQQFTVPASVREEVTRVPVADSASLPSQLAREKQGLETVLRVVFNLNLLCQSFLVNFWIRKTEESQCGGIEL